MSEASFPIGDGQLPGFGVGSGIRGGRVRCDAAGVGGCEETHPLEHELLGDPSFGTGRWLGWVYLDINRPDLLDRELRFCSVGCCTWWLDRQILTAGRREKTALDRALRRPQDEVQRARAGLQRQEHR